jgi:hypothetical protein
MHTRTVYTVTYFSSHQNTVGGSASEVHFIMFIFSYVFSYLHLYFHSTKRIILEVEQMLEY